MSKLEYLFMSLVVGLVFGLATPAIAADQESYSATTQASSLAQDGSVEALAQGAAKLIALASSSNLSTGTQSVNGMCPLFRGCYKKQCGVASMLTGENAITDEQYEQFYQLKIKKKDEMDPLKVEMKKHKRHMDEMMGREEIDAKAIKKMQERMAVLSKDMMALKLDYKLQMAQVLTGSQRKAVRMSMLKGNRKKYSSASRMMRNWMKRKMMQ